MCQISILPSKWVDRQAQAAEQMEATADCTSKRKQAMVSRFSAWWVPGLRGVDGLATNLVHVFISICCAFGCLI